MQIRGIHGCKRSGWYSSSTQAICVILSVLAVNAATPAMAVSPFWSEGFESLAPGDISGQNGWWAPLRSWPVAIVHPSAGAQHLRGEADGLGLSLAYSPIILDPNQDAYLSILADVSITPGETWDIIAQDVSNGHLVTTIRFASDGTIQARTDVGGLAPFADTGASYPINEYFEIALTVSRADKSYALYLNGQSIFSGQGFSSTVDQLAFMSQMDVVGPVIDVDDIRMYDSNTPIVPEPSAMHLSTIAVVLTAVSRRFGRQLKRRRS
jgi:hypothetical protein